MCGIAGIISPRVNSESIWKMVHIQQHRGPDNSSAWIDPEIGLGHNRLSIIDLSDQANQPFKSSDGRYVIVFNGEIYNYIELKDTYLKHKPLRTNSDTEVLLELYVNFGTKCLDLIRGMFAFAIWDTKNKILFAARDRFGVKPFYYSKNNIDFIFASEIKAILASGFIPKKIDTRVLASYMAYASYGNPEESFYEGISQLPAGHYLLIENNSLTIEKYYDFFERIRDRVDSVSTWASAIEELEHILFENIKLRLRSDVNVGFNLSGGIDSTLLFQLIKRSLDTKLTSAFTFVSGDERYDEDKWVASFLGATELPWYKAKISVKEIDKLARKIQYHMDEPYAGIATLAYSKVFEAAREKNVLVLLDGSGIDEQFVGYDYYRSGSNTPVQGTKSPSTRPGCLDEDFLKLAQRPVYPAPFDSKILNMQYRDIFHTKLQRDMRFNDRISMSHSVELREPFLDHTLFEFAFSLPLSMKMNNNKGKYIIREIVKHYVNNGLVTAPKRPIQTPQREWLSENLREWVQDMVATAVNQSGFLIESEVDKELSLFFNGRNENSFYVWQWISIAMMQEC